MKNKTFLLAATLAFVTLFTLTACGATPSSPATSVAVSSALIIPAPETSPPETSIPSDSLAVSAISEDLEKALLMPNAKDIVSQPGALGFSVSVSMDEAKAFYEDALKTLNAKGDKVDSKSPLSWSFSGTYEDGKELHITLTENSTEKGTFVSISYT